MSDAKAAILAAVRAARPAPIAAPETWAVASTFARPDIDPAVRFAEVACAVGAVVETTLRGDLPAALGGACAGARRVLSLVPGLASTIQGPRDVHGLRDLDVFVAGGMLGVAECGAIWVAPEGSASRAALFLAERVVLVIDREAIVHDLHEAYTRINVGAAPFGVFVAGPSKTADIEQSLVIGAHGPKALTVIVVSDELPGRR